jgi:hypothetical protein
MLVLDEEAGRGWNGDEGSRRNGRLLFFASTVGVIAITAAGGLWTAAHSGRTGSIKMPTTFLETNDSTDGNRIFKGPANRVDQIDCGDHPPEPTHVSVSQAYLANQPDHPTILSVGNGLAKVRCSVPLSWAIDWLPPYSPQQ